MCVARTKCCQTSQAPPPGQPRPRPRQVLGHGPLVRAGTDGCRPRCPAEVQTHLCSLSLFLPCISGTDRQSMIEGLVPAPVVSCPQRLVVEVAVSPSKLPATLTGLTWTVSQSSNTQRKSKIDAALKFGTSSFPKEPKVKQLFLS